MAQYTGTVSWFNNAKGYGFLSYEGGPDVFCHYSAITAEGYKTLNAGDTVDFDIVVGNTGKPQADHVQPTAHRAGSAARPLSPEPISN